MKINALSRIFVIQAFIFFSSVQLFAGASNKGCAEFYHIKRPIVASLIWHEYIGINHTKVEVAGLPKAKDDLHFFLKYLDGEDLSTQGTVLMPSFTYLGKACGKNKMRALKIAHQISHRLQRKQASWTQYLIRMGLTPVMGKPCRQAALEITKNIEAFVR